MSPRTLWQLSLAGVLDGPFIEPSSFLCMLAYPRARHGRRIDGADDRHHHRHGAGRPDGRRCSPAWEGDVDGWGPAQFPGNRAQGEEHGAVIGVV